MRTVALMLSVVVLGALCGTNPVDARRKDRGGIDRKDRGGGSPLQPPQGMQSIPTKPQPAPDRGSNLGGIAHAIVSVVAVSCVLISVRIATSMEDAADAHKQTLGVVICSVAAEAAAQLLVPLPQASVTVMTIISVLFTINPVLGASRLSALHMGSVPPLCVLWLIAVGILSYEDVARSLYGTDSLRPYHLVVMFLGSVYLCTALERSGFLHTAAVKVVQRYGRSPWGLFWALGCFSAMLTVLIPDDIVTMTLTPITIRMCQLLNLPEIPFLFSQFFAGNIWAVTLVTGNPTNVLLAEDLGDSFISFAARMGIPGVAAGLTSFVLMYWTNRANVDVVASVDKGHADDDCERLAGGSGKEDAPVEDEAFTSKGVFCLIRVLAATAFCALENVHGLPVYLVVLCMGLGSFIIDLLLSARDALEVLRHMPWELFSFVTGDTTRQLLFQQWGLHA